MTDGIGRSFQEQQDVIFKTSQLKLKLGEQTANLSMRHAIAYLGHNFPKDLQGLFLWPASEAMAEFSLQNAHLFANKKVVEIGSGTGLFGLAIASVRPSPEKVLLTDGCQASVDLLEMNVR